MIELAEVTAWEITDPDDPLHQWLRRLLAEILAGER
jgi:hypothetical protein